MTVARTAAVDDTERMDFSFVRRELEHLEDIPRGFDEALFQRLGVSGTVIRFWREHGFNPGYFHRFWLLQQQRERMMYGEYEKICDTLIEPMMLENPKIGGAVRNYREEEKHALSSFFSVDTDYIYMLSTDYEDGSGSMLLMATDFAALRDQMERERCRDAGFKAERYLVEHDADGIRIEKYCGSIFFRNDGKLKHYGNLQGFAYTEMEGAALLSPYILMPQPFGNNDLVQFSKMKNPLRNP